MQNCPSCGKLRDSIIFKDASRLGKIKEFILMDENRSYNDNEVYHKLKRIYPEMTLTKEEFLKSIGVVE